MLVLTFLVYKNTLYNNFVFDDIEQITQNQWIRDFNHIPDIFTSGAWSFREFANDNGIYYRPMMHLFFMIEYHFFEINPYGYHLINILLHFLNSVIYFIFSLFLLNKIFLPDSKLTTRKNNFAISLLSAVIFLLHPINSETVNWISAIPELTFSLFFILSIYFYLKSENKLFYFLSILSFIFSLLCKETAITIPLFLLAYNFFIRFKSEDIFKKLILNSFKFVSLYFIITLIYILIRELILKPEIHAGNVNFLFVIFAFMHCIQLLVLNLFRIVFPVKLSIFHSYKLNNISIFCSAFATALIIVYSYLTFKYFPRIKFNKIVLFGVILFVIPLLPALNFFMLNEFVLSERYLYLPSMGFSLIIAFLILKVSNLFRNERTKTISLAVIVVPVICFFSATIIKRNAEWNNDFSIFTDAKNKFPESKFARLLLAEAYCKTGNINNCKKQYLKYCELLKSVENYELESCFKNSNYHQILGDAYFKSKNYDGAIEQYELALKSSESPSEIYMNLGLVYYKLDNRPHALKYLQIALSFNPKSPTINSNLGLYYCGEEDYEKSNVYFSRALQLGKNLDEVIYEKNDCIKALLQ